MLYRGPVKLVTTGDVGDHVPRALQLLSDLADRAELGNVQTLSTTVALDDSTYAYAVVAGGVRAVHIIGADQSSSDNAIQPKKRAVVPDFVSGAVNYGYILAGSTDPITGVVTPKKMQQFHPTQNTATKFKMPFGYQNVQRLALEPSSAVKDLTNPDTTIANPKVYAQSRRQKPTLYSGLMRKVVQALHGFGIQTTKSVNGQQVENSWYDQQKPPSTSTLPPTPSSTYNSQVAKNGLQIAYDFHFGSTHGILVGQDGVKWLCEISITRGVLIMPLSLNGPSTDPAFKTKLTTLGDSDGLALLAEFGGFPSGEPLPASSDLPAWIRSGRVIQLLKPDDLNDFYGNNNSSYSDIQGWSFNKDGNEAINTCYNYVENTAISYHYSISFGVGGMRSKNTDAASAIQTLSKSFAALRSKSGAAMVDAAIWKLDYMATGDILTASGYSKASDALAYVDGLTVTVATANASMSQINSGYWYYVAKISPQIKFPNMTLGFLVSMDFNLLWGFLPVIDHALKCDTIMFSYFQGNDMKVVKYYYDPRGAQPAKESDDFETCMNQGSWSQHTDSGVFMGPQFYTTDCDDRHDFAATATDVKIVGTSLGYSSIQVADDIVDPAYGNATRTKRFRECRTSHTATGETGATAICVPFYDREAYYYCYGHTLTGTSDSYSCSYNTVTDPWSCPTWRNFPGYMGQWVDTTGHGNWILVRAAQHPDGCGPVTYRCAMSPSPVYTNSTCSDDADSGPWCFVCSNLDAMVYSLPAPPLPPSTNTTGGAVGTRTVKCVSSEAWGEITTYNGNGGMGRWARPSPDPDDGTTDYVEETQSVLGNTDSIRLGGGIDPGDPAIILRGGLEWDGLTEDSLTYIGVV